MLPEEFACLGVQSGNSLVSADHDLILAIKLDQQGSGPTGGEVLFFPQNGTVLHAETDYAVFWAAHRQEDCVLIWKRGCPIAVLHGGRTVFLDKVVLPYYFAGVAVNAMQLGPSSRR